MKLLIKNYKCFLDQAIEFGQLTVLAGSNSAGKSSTIQALLLTRIAFEKDKKKENNIPVNGEYCLELGLAKGLRNKYAGDEPINFQVSDNDIELVDIDLEINSLYDLTVKKEKEFPSISSNILANNFYYLNAERVGPRLEYGMSNFTHVGYQGEYAVQIVSGFDTKIDSKKLFDGNNNKELRSQAHSWLEYITPGVTIDGGSLFEEVRRAQMRISGTTPTNVGFGVSYVLPIIVNGLIAVSDSIFIVENPEAHLHPSAQSRIGRFLAKIAASGVKVIIETHSEHVINGIRIATLSPNYDITTDEVIINFFNRKSEDTPPIIHQIDITPKGDLTSFPADFFDQNQQDLAEIIRLKRQIQEGQRQ